MTPGVQIVVGALGGILVGVVAHVVGVDEGTLRVIGFPGKLYINALMLFVCPYICCTMFLSHPHPPAPARTHPHRCSLDVWLFFVTKL